MVIAQNSTIGNYTIYENNNEYYLLSGSDTLCLDKYGMTIKFDSVVTETGKTTFEQDYNLTLMHESVGSYNYYTFSPTSNFITVCDSIYDDTKVDEFCFDYTIKLYGFIPDDDYLDNQWYLDQIDVFETWNLTIGRENVTVAVIDDGLFLGHDDIYDDDEIVENVYHNPGEDMWYSWDDPTGGNNIDDDGNGKLNDWKGWNYCNHVGPVLLEEDNNVTPEVSWAYHGTAVSGVIAARTNNDYGIAGIAGGDHSDNDNPDDNISGIKILPIKIIDWKWNPIFEYWELVSSTGSIAAAIDYTVAMGADIINLSLGLPNTNAVKVAIENAYNSGVLLVAAAGNEGEDDWIAYPAKDLNVVAVGATDMNDEAAIFPIGASNHGDELELTAPGVDIDGLNDDGIESYMWGTSFSSPMVCATAALMLSVNPGLSNNDIRNILKTTAEKVGSNPYDQNGWNKYLGYGRINTFLAVCEAISLLDPLTVNATTTWDEPKYSVDDIVIGDDIVLTITSALHMAADASIIIEPGGKLIVDGGTIKNACDDHWQGIEVWGNPSNNQHPDNKGYLVLKNGAVVENAISAVELWEPDVSSKTGGIVQATDAVFRNNAKSLHAEDYANLHPVTSQEVDNLSFFKNCTFEITDEYNMTQTFEKHVKLDRVKGIQFDGCWFTVADIQQVDDHCVGIESNSAGFSLTSACANEIVPCNEYRYPSFDGFYTAIEANDTYSNLKTFIVEEAEFTNNTYGIKVQDVYGYSVLFSDFYIGRNNADEEACEGIGQQASGFGIWSDASTGFAIEENYFTQQPGSPTGTYTGIRIAETLATDEVYKNDFDDLNYGNYTEGKNWAGSNTENGLAFYCNLNIDNTSDFYIVKGDGFLQGGVQSNQGWRDEAAGNTFTQAGASWHLYNGGDFRIFYYHSNYNSLEDPTDALLHNVTDHGINYTNACPSHYGGGTEGGRGVVLSEEEKLETEALFVEGLNNYNNYKALYEQLKDGGSTETLLTEVETAWPTDMWELREELLGKSPHLSQEVLMAAADKSDVLPDAVLFEILAANPDELKKVELMKYLEDKENPLPEYMLDVLRQVASGTTYKTVLEQHMAHYNQVKTRAANDMIRSILNEEETDNDALRNWLDNMGGQRADEQIIATWLQEGNYANTLNLANLLPQLYNYDEAALAEHNYYLDMLNLNIFLKQEGRAWDELSTPELNSISYIAANSHSTAGSMAKAILESNYGTHYCNCLAPADSTSFKSSSLYNPEAIQDMLGGSVSVNPNPANNWTAFEYTLPEAETEGKIEITDLKGNVLELFMVTGKQGIQIWDTRIVTSGVYFYTFTANNVSTNGKIIISK